VSSRKRKISSDVQRVLEHVQEIGVAGEGAPSDFDFSPLPWMDIHESVHLEHVVAAHIANNNSKIDHDISMLLLDIEYASVGFYDSESIKRHIESDEQSQERRRVVPELLREAAVLSGFPPTYYINIIEKHWTTHGYGPEAEPRADETVEQYWQRMRFYLIPSGLTSAFGLSELLGKRGGSSNPDGATRGIVVRMIARYVPSNTRHRFAAISYFAKLTGVDADNHLVRSILLKGRT